MPDISNSYYNGAPKWNPKYRLPTNGIPSPPSPPTKIFSIGPIDCREVTVSLADESIYISQRFVVGTNAVTIAINEIVSLNVNTDSIVINTDDNNSFFVYFSSNADTISVTNRITSVMNGIEDPGC